MKRWPYSLLSVSLAAACGAPPGERSEGQPDWRSRRADGRLPASPHGASATTTSGRCSPSSSHWRSREVLATRREMLRNK